MIKINNLNKYYYRKEERELHVVNDVNLELPSSGLVTILGASGSGKTTLLNIIGGLDKQDSGSITYDNAIFEKYNMKNIDSFRSKKIGYIFQNYLLLENYSVYNNLRIQLEVIGVLDIKEQRKRIEYALRCVGLFKFKNKKVRNLSGGQMQRVSIARALVKNCDIIIADEPTGNVDSENTIQIMNILKKISEKKLVLLVTHELNIARFYSDRIIQIKDGKIISDGKVVSRGKLNTQTDRKLYLKDYNNEEFKLNNLNVQFYSDDASTLSNVKIIVRNDTIYIQSEKNIVNLNETSIQVVDESYQDLVEEEAKDFNFDTSWFTEPKELNKKQNFIANFLNGWYEYKNQSKGRVIFKIIFIILGIFMGSCFISLSNYVKTDYSNNIKEENIYVINNKEIEQSYPLPLYDTEIIKEANNAGYIEEIIPVYSTTTMLYISDNFVTGKTETISFWELPYNNNVEILIGNRPINKEVVIGKALADQIIAAYKLSKNSYELLLGLEINSYKICGIAENDANSVYINPVILYSGNKNLSRTNSNDIQNYNNYKDYINITVGSAPDNDSILVSENYMKLFNLTIGSSVSIRNKDFFISGFYSDNKNINLPNILSVNEEIVSLSYDFHNKNAIITNYRYVEIYLPEYEYNIVSGRKANNDLECIANVNSNLEIGQKVNNYTVVGLYDKNYENGSVGNEFCYDTLIITNGNNYSGSSNYFGYKFTSDAESYFEEFDYEIISVKTYQDKYTLKEHQKSQITLPIVIVILLVLVILLTYFSNRSKIIGEIQNLGVLRSIGKSKKSIINQKIYYNIIQSTFTSVVGYAIAWIFYNYFANAFGAITNQTTTMNAFIIILGIVVIYIINVFVGILPSLFLLKKTPSEIISKYDI